MCAVVACLTPPVNLIISPIILVTLFFHYHIFNFLFRFFIFLRVVLLILYKCIICSFGFSLNNTVVVWEDVHDLGHLLILVMILQYFQDFIVLLLMNRTAAPIATVLVFVRFKYFLHLLEFLLFPDLHLVFFAGHLPMPLLHLILLQDLRLAQFGSLDSNNLAHPVHLSFLISGHVGPLRLFFAQLNVALGSPLAKLSHAIRALNIWKFGGTVHGVQLLYFAFVLWSRGRGGYDRLNIL